MRITVTLPPVAEWTKAKLVEAGIPADAGYSELTIRKGRMVLVRAGGFEDTLIGRLMCIKGRSGSTDAGHRAKLDGYTTTELTAELA